MSATLGEGGDLERMTGLKKIERIECPEKWKKRTVGRRLFLFPDLYHEDDKYKLCVNLIKEANRALIITSSNPEVVEWKDKHLKKLKKKYEYISALEFEKDSQIFTDEEKAILFLANRYDGVDLVNDECRLLILANLSKGLNLQDKFLLEKVLANTNFLDRLRTKMTQMIGRCTRSETDYSLVVVMGTELTDFFNDHKYRNLLHPEIQAEVKFGIEQSAVEGVDEYLENFKIFLEQGDDWKDADDDIASLRQESVQKKIDGSDVLASVAKKEVQLQYDLWNKNYTEALDLAKSILGLLEKSDLDGYTGFWRYYTGYIYYLLKIQKNENIGRDVSEYFSEASKKITSVNWLGRLANQYSQNKIVLEDNSQIQRQVSNIVSMFASLGITHNAKFDIEINKILDYTANGKAEKFEQAQCALGELLGFKAGKEETDASPDPWWILSNKFVVVFEDHSDARKTGALGANKARQAISHGNWLREKLNLSEDVEIIHVLVTPKVKIADGAIPQLKNNACIWNLDEYKKWVTATIATIREVRTDFRLDDLTSRMKLMKVLEANNLDCNGMVDFLKTKLFKG